MGKWIIRPRIGFTAEMYLRLARPQPEDWLATTERPSTLRAWNIPRPVPAIEHEGVMTNE